MLGIGCELDLLLTDLKNIGLLKVLELTRENYILKAKLGGIAFSIKRIYHLTFQKVRAVNMKSG